MRRSVAFICRRDFAASARRTRPHQRIGARIAASVLEFEALRARGFIAPRRFVPLIDETAGRSGPGGNLSPSAGANHRARLRRVFRAVRLTTRKTAHHGQRFCDPHDGHARQSKLGAVAIIGGGLPACRREARWPTLDIVLNFRAASLSRGRRRRMNFPARRSCGQLPALLLGCCTNLIDFYRRSSRATDSLV